jgi:hypothetical protein
MLGILRKLHAAVLVMPGFIVLGSGANLSVSAGASIVIALPVSGDNERMKRVAFRLVEDAGFNPVDGGTLAESWRQQPGTGAYTTDLDEAQLRKALVSLTPRDRAFGGSEAGLSRRRNAT